MTRWTISKPSQGVISGIVEFRFSQDVSERDASDDFSGIHPEFVIYKVSDVSFRLIIDRTPEPVVGEVMERLFSAPIQVGFVAF